MYRYSLLCMVLWLLCVPHRIGAGVNESDSGTVLSISGISIPASYFEHWLIEKAIDDNAVRCTSDIIPVIESSIDEYTEKLYYLAEAYDLGIDNDPKIDQAVDITARTIVTQYGGYLYTDIVKDISVGMQQVDEALSRRDREFDIEYRRFPYGYPVPADSARMLSLLHDDHEDIPVTCGSVYGAGTYVWPYKELFPFRDTIYHSNGTLLAHVQDITGDYIVHVTKQHLRQSEGPENKDGINNIIQQTMTQHATTCYESSLLTNAGLCIDAEVFQKMADHIHSAEQKSQIFAEEIAPIADLVLITYTLNGSDIRITVQDFADYYNTKMLRRALTDYAQLFTYTKECAFDALAYHDAIDRGITQTNQFLAEYMHFRMKLILQEYDAYLLSIITPTSDEITQEYNTHQTAYSTATACNVSILTFDEMDNAQRAFMTMQNKQTPADSYASLPGCVMAENGVELTPEQNRFSTQHTQVLFSNPGQLILLPFIENDIPYLIIKHAETGTRTIPLDEVRDQIVAVLKQQKLEQVKADMLPELKKKYTLIDNIDYDKYLSEEWIESVMAEK